MKTNFLLFLATFYSLTTWAQINSADSSAQVVGYWSIGDKQSYAVTYEKFKVQNGDTASRTMMTYEVDITVKDSTEKGYIVEWFYKNYKVDTDNAWVQKVSKTAQDISVRIKTDEFGAILEVLNWKEVSNHITKAMKPLKKEFKKMPAVAQLIEQTTAI